MRKNAKLMIDWKAGLNEKATQVIVDKIKQNAMAGIGSFGRKFTKKDGQPMQWKETGALLNSIHAYNGGRISVTADYAEAVNSKFPFMDGFTDEDKADMSKRIQPIMAEAFKHNRR